MSGIESRWVAADDPLLRPLVDDLARDYDERYEPNDGVPSSAELTRYAPERFAPAAGGGFLALLDRGDLVAGGALMAGSARAAEVKRMWTRLDRRRQGLAARVLEELEDRAAELGYRRLELATGARQPEAVGLYLSRGWRPLFDLAGDWEEVGYLRFEKAVRVRAG